MSEKIDPDVAAMIRAVDMLAEYFENVQVFASRFDEEGTVTMQKGSGNWCARLGQVRNWLIRQDESEREEQRNAELD